MLWNMFTWHVKWTNITHDKATWDFADVKLKITRSHNVPVVSIDFPALKKWEISANQELDSWLIPATGPVNLYF